MMKLKTKRDEYNHFNRLSNEWWDDNGKFKVLHQIRPIRMEYILNQIDTNNIKNLDFLDVGCGGGLICEPIAKLGGNVTGIDFVSENIKIAKKHAKEKNIKINYICDDIEKLNINKKFDFIIMFEILEHLDDWKNFLKKTKKNLKKNGKIIISTINRNLISKYAAIYIAENFLKWIPKGTHEYKKFIKPEEIENYANTLTLKINNINGMVYNPLYNSWQFSKNNKINYFCTLIQV